MFFIEERNRADQVIHDIDTKLDEYKDQLDADEVTQLKEDAASVSLCPLSRFSNFWISWKLTCLTKTVTPKKSERSMVISKRDLWSSLRLLTKRYEDAEMILLLKLSKGMEQNSGNSSEESKDEKKE